MTMIGTLTYEYFWCAQWRNNWSAIMDMDVAPRALFRISPARPTPSRCIDAPHMVKGPEPFHCDLHVCNPAIVSAIRIHKLLGCRRSIDRPLLCPSVYRFLPGPFGRANAFFFSFSTTGAAAPLAEGDEVKPSSNFKNSSLISCGSEVSILRSTTNSAASPRRDFPARWVERTAEEYVMRNLTGEAEGQE